MDLNGEVYFSLGKSIYTYYENEFHLFVDLSSTLFPGARRGRSEKDIFTNGEGGLGHFNGSDFKIIYELSSNYRISDIFLFPSDVFFMCYTFDYNSGIVIHGKLKNSVAESH